MPSISQKTKNRISEQILQHLFITSPNATFTSKIAEEIARDEEFTKSILQDLAKKNLVVEVKKTPSGTDYKVRRRWRLSSNAFDAYKKHQL